VCLDKGSCEIGGGELFVSGAVVGPNVYMSVTRAVEHTNCRQT